jgi:hypothetical protein
LGFVAKYWANGIYPGHAGGQMLYLEINQKTGAETAMGGSNTCVFTNAFGRTVVAYSLIPTDPNSVWGKLHSKFGTVVTQVQVIPTTFTVTTHLDFFNMYRKDGCFFTPLIARAGKPLDTKNTAFCYQTIDGYTYYVQGTIGSGAYLQAIYDPQGTLLNDDQVRALTTNVLLINLSIAAVLSVVLVLLIKIPNAIRKRKAAVQGD